MMTTGVLRAILDAWPAAAVDLVVRAGHESLPLPQRGRIIPFNRRHDIGRRLRRYPE